MIHLYIEADIFFVEKKYTFDLIFNNLGLRYEFCENLRELSEKDFVIYYSKTRKETRAKSLWIKATDNLFNKNYLKGTPDYKVKRYKLDKPIKSIKDIISIFSEEENLFSKDEKEINIYIDIISDIFFMVTRYEEVISTKRDYHNRYELEDSIAYKCKFLDRPIVNEQIEFLFNEISSILYNIKKVDRWDGKDFAFFLSHDIDTISKYKDKFFRSFASTVVRDKDIKKATGILTNACKSVVNINTDPYWKFDYLLNIEKKHGIFSSYYFMSGGETKKDNYYNINSKVLNKVFDNIKSNYSEIGIHGSYNSYNNQDLLNKEIMNMSNICNVVGIRQHYLRFKVPETWEIQSKCNLVYDSTIGFAKEGGFRCGICTPFKPFNVLTRSVINIWEIPLIIMDGTISDKEYMNLKPQVAINYVKDIIMRIKDVNGVFSLLWHNSSLDETSKWKDWINVYEELLEYIIDSKALSISGINIIDRYK